MDKQFPHRAAEMLRLLQYELHEANQISALMNVKYDDDVDCLIWARHHDAILLSADRLTKGKNEKGFTPIRIADELRANGGRIITLGGGPQQLVERLVAKVLYHQFEWESFFAGGPGKFHVGTLNPESITRRRPDQLPTTITHMQVTQGAEYLEAKEKAKRQPPNKNLRRPRDKKQTAGGAFEEME